MERKIAIVTDSSCDIPKELAEKYGIDVIDFPINLDGKEYYERRGMTMDQFYELMRAAQGVPTTAAITALQCARCTRHTPTRDTPTFCM